MPCGDYFANGGCNQGDCPRCTETLQGEPLEHLLSTAMHSATYAALARLTDIIAHGREDDAISACETLFEYTLSLAASEQ